ncbi:CPBP family intramembrane glutamic endopeptidase [Quadrisphaera sp. DSM 44207]|uniref:CPBP family intramembrane glutamic endopeptidase n=1 Tax=Quadrisphaera sp. DSM 44207 TaxID=1881057 RepID=UPI00088E9AD3|nr:CPBP family intramembrane glutamic endopeptidase [Quadrisphaera sp. DSM 44207]SDQ05907.1 Membrane protease YdiL, CAAX protease family [Quadrisphaera sp. DSM 44207]
MRRRGPGAASEAGGARRWAPLAALSLGLLGWSNVVVPHLPPGAGRRTLSAVAATAVLLLAARCAGLTRAELGLHPSTWGRGARWGAGALGVVVLGYGLVLAVPALRAGLADPRVDALSPGEVAVRALVLIPLGTVLWEEVAFRGVLLATAQRVLPPGRALAVTSAVFGLWHLSSAAGVPVPAAFPLPRVLSVVGVVLVTAAGGLALGWLRQRSSSLLAPVGLHLGTNSVGLAAAAAAAALR